MCVKDTDTIPFVKILKNCSLSVHLCKFFTWCPVYELTRAMVVMKGFVLVLYLYKLIKK